MWSMSGGEVDGEVRLRLVADAASVPAARRFVRDALRGWDLPQLSGDAELCVSEMSSNAALHSASAYFEVVVTEAPGGAVRLGVYDAGTVPVAALVARGPEVMGPGGMDEVATTGRGLTIIDALASSWGVEETGPGKHVWAVLGTPEQSGSSDGAGRRRLSPARQPSAVETHDAALPTGWHRVRLSGCPVGLGLQQDRHLDDLVRELQLIDSGAAAPSRELAEVIGGLLRGQAHARHMGRRTALDAAAAGLEVVDIEMTVPAVAAVDIRMLDQAVRQADALCHAEQLLTLASPPEVVALRAWMTHEFVAQIDRAEAPTSYERWRTLHPDDGQSRCW